MAFSPRDIQAVLFSANILMDKDEATSRFNNELQLSLLTCKLRNYIHPLTLLVVLDSRLTGNFDLIRFRVITSPYTEQKWILDYLLTRYRWLKDNNKAGLNHMLTLLNLVKDNNWGLSTPFEIDGFTIEETDLMPMVANDNQIDSGSI